MIQDTKGWLNVHDVARQMGIELINEHAWSAGNAVRGLWIYKVGTPPLKDNRTKKAGVGSHCFALYPPSWRADIERCVIEAIRSGGAISAAQLELGV